MLSALHIAAQIHDIGAVTCGKPAAPFFAPFLYTKSDHFANTGS
jgi:hypothetical protein